MPTWVEASADMIADPADYTCRRCYLINGCPKCAEKTQKALGADRYVEVADGKFAIVSAPMTEKAAAEAFASTGVELIFCLPVLD